MPFANVYLILLLSMLLQGCGSEHSPPSNEAFDLPAELTERSASSLWKNPENGLIYHNDKRFTGVAIRTYTNGQFAEKTTYLNGHKHGPRKKWFANGLQSYQAQYNASRLDGVVLSWWNNGSLRSWSYYEDGVAEGEQKEWYATGQLFKVVHLKNGKEEGIQQAWRQNGKLFTNYEARNGRIFGLKRANLCYELKQETIVFND